MAQLSHVGTPEVPEELRPLVRQLAALSSLEREAVIDAARKVANDQKALPTTSWQALRSLKGIVSLGGNALEDSEALYDEF
jgi:hypothetical protein